MEHVRALFFLHFAIFLICTSNAFSIGAFNILLDIDVKKRSNKKTLKKRVKGKYATNKSIGHYLKNPSLIWHSLLALISKLSDRSKLWKWFFVCLVAVTGGAILIFAYPVLMLFATREAIANPAEGPPVSGVKDMFVRVLLFLLVVYILYSTGSYLFEFITTGAMCGRGRYGGVVCSDFKSDPVYVVVTFFICHIFFWTSIPLLVSMFTAKVHEK